MNDTPGQIPTVTERSRIGFRFSVMTWWGIAVSGCGAASTVIGFILWLNTMHTDIAACKAGQVQQVGMLDEHTAALRRIEDALRELQLRQRYGITTSLPKLREETP